MYSYTMNLAPSSGPLISIVAIPTGSCNLTANLQAVIEAAPAIKSAEIILVCHGYRPDLSFLSTKLSLQEERLK